MLEVDKPFMVIESVLAHALTISTPTHGLVVGNISVCFDSFDATHLLLPSMQIESTQLDFVTLLWYTP